MRRLTGLTAVCVAVLGAIAPVASGTDSRLAHRADRAFQSTFEAGGVPGAQAAVMRNGRMLWSGAAGYQSRGVGVRGSDRFVIASVTKTIMATLVMHLVEQGDMALDDTVRSFGVEVPNGDRITVAQLLSHRSGLPEYFDDPLILLNVRDPHHPWTRQEPMRAIQRGLPQFEPGATFTYNNSNYIVLGEIVERVSGLAVDDLLASVIAAPLGLRSLSFDENRPTGAIAHGHTGAKAGDTYAAAGNTTPTDVVGPVWTDGGIATDARDLAAYTDALFRGQILARHSVQQMIPAQGGYGFGLETHKSPTGGPLYGHEGLYGGFTSSIDFDRRSHTSVAVLVNSEYDDRVPAQIADRLRLALDRRR